MPNTFDCLFTELLIVSTPMKLEVLPQANTFVTQSAPNMEKDPSHSKTQESGSKYFSKRIASNHLQKTIQKAAKESP